MSSNRASSASVATSPRSVVVRTRSLPFRFLPSFSVKGTPSLSSSPSSTAKNASSSSSFFALPFAFLPPREPSALAASRAAFCAFFFSLSLRWYRSRVVSSSPPVPFLLSLAPKVEAAVVLSPGRKLISSSPALSLPIPPHPSGRFLSFPLKRSARRRSRLLCFRLSPVVARDVWDAPDSDSEPEEAMYAWKSSSSISFRESVRRVTRLRSGSSSSQVSLTFECRRA